jgi:hypothetical protein
MPNSCVVYGCNSTANKELGISVFGFPDEKTIKRQWVRFVQRSRIGFKEPEPGNRSTVICSRYFSIDSLTRPLTFQEGERK